MVTVADGGVGRDGGRTSGQVSGPHPHSHRRPGSAAVGLPPERQSIGRIFWQSPREPLLVALGALFGLGWGVWTLVSAQHLGQRAAGLVAVIAGALVATSYLLRFHPSVLADQWCFKSTPRRALRLVLAYSWLAFLAVVVVAWMATVFPKL